MLTFDQFTATAIAIVDKLVARGLAATYEHPCYIAVQLPHERQLHCGTVNTYWECQLIEPDWECSESDCSAIHGDSTDVDAITNYIHEVYRLYQEGEL